MSDYALVLDDSGTKEYAPAGRAYGPNNTRHFVFGGLLLRTAAERRLSADIIRLKLDAFGTSDVEVKSNWLRVPRERRRRYINRYNISEGQLDEFVRLFYESICAAELVLLACVVDKVDMIAVYGDRAWYPPAAAYEAVMQRAQLAMADHAAATLQVVVDDMTGATPKGNQYRHNLRRHHLQLRQRGSTLWPGIHFPGLERDIAFVDSAASHMVQVADVVAYNVFRQFAEHAEAWEDMTLAQLPLYDWFRRLAAKFRCDATGRIQGYGVVKMPLLRRVRWSLARPKKEPRL